MKTKEKTGLNKVVKVFAASVALGAASTARSDTEVSKFRSDFDTAEKFTFMQLVTGSEYVWCGTTGDVFDENWCVWESAEVDGVRTNGILQTGDFLKVANQSDQKAKLLVGSGSYTFPWIQLAAGGGKSEVVVTGGVFRASSGDIALGQGGGESTFIISNGTVSAAYWLTAGRGGATTSTIEVHGGTLTTAYRDGVEQTGNTGNGMIDLGDSNGSKVTFRQTGGRVHAAGSANNADKFVAMSVGNSGGSEVDVELTGGEMDLDGRLEVPRYGTGTFTMSGGSLDVLDELYIAAGADSTGSLTVTGGAVNVQSFMQVGRGSGSTGTFAMSNATVDISRYMAVGFGSNSTAKVDVSGGTLNLKGNTEGIGFLIGDNVNAANSQMTVRGNGVVNAAADSHVGWNSAGTLTIKDDGYVGVGSASNHRWLIINHGSDVTGHSVINLDGGTLDVCHVQMNNLGDESADVNFNGGRINVYAYNNNAVGNLFGNLTDGDLRVYIKENGGTISVVEGATIAVNEPLLTGVDEGTDGGFIKAGDGTLTLAATNNTYIGATVVKGGSLVLPEGGTLASTRLVLDGGTFTGEHSFDTIVINAGSFTFSELPVADTGNVTLNGGVLRMTSAEAKATEGVASVVVNGGRLLIDASVEEGLADGTTVSFSDVTLGANVSAGDVLKVGGAHFDWTYASSDAHPTITAGAPAGENVWIGGPEGVWNDMWNWSYGLPSSATITNTYFNEDATIIIDSDKTAQSLRVNANVTFRTADNVDPSILFNDLDGTGKLRLDHVGLKGNGGDRRIGSPEDNELVLEFVWDTTDSWLQDVNVYAPITGAGYVRIYGGVMLWGDNCAFTGKVRKDDGDSRFMVPEAGFPHATNVEILGTIWLWFDEGEIEFGGNFTAYSSGNCGINLPGTVRAVTMTVGGGDGSVILSRGWDKKWHPYYSAFVDSNGWQKGTDKFTLRKVGSGAITEFGIEGTYNFSLEGGSINLVAETVYTGSDTILTVSNATFGIAVDTTIASVDFKGGSTLRSTYYETTEDETTTYGVKMLTVTGAATLDGVQLTAAGTTPNVETIYTVLSADSASGTVESKVDDPDDTDKKGWLAKVGSSSVYLRYGSRHPGFRVSIR